MKRTIRERRRQVFASWLHLLFDNFWNVLAWDAPDGAVHFYVFLQREFLPQRVILWTVSHLLESRRQARPHVVTTNKDLKISTNLCGVLKQTTGKTSSMSNLKLSGKHQRRNVEVPPPQAQVM